MRFQALARGAVVVTLGTVVPTVALAQMPTAPAGQRVWRVGVRVEGAYDSNISRTSEDVTNVRQLTKDDYILTPNVTAAISQPFGRQVAFLSGDVGYAFYRKNSELDRRRASVNGGVAGILGPCRPMVFGGYDAAQSDLANLNVGTTKNLAEQTRIGVGASCSRGIGPGASFTLQRSETNNSDATVRESNATTEIGTLQLIFARPTLGTFSAGFTHSSTEFPNRINPGRPVGDGFFTQSYFVGYTRNFGSRLKFAGQGGVTHLKREFAPPGVDQSMNSYTYSADVTYGLGDRIEFSASGSRAITPSIAVGKTFDKSTRLGVAASYRAGQRIRLETGYTWQEIDSNVDTAAALLVVTNSQIHTVSGKVAFNANERLSLSLDVRYEDREANLPQFTYNAARIGITAQTSF